MATASFVASADRDALVFQAEGDWLLATAAELDRRLRALELPSGREVVLDLAGVERLDTAGAWLLKRTDNELAARGNAVTLANVRTNLAPLLEQVWTHGAAQPLPHPVPAHHTLAGFVARIGEVSVLLMRRAYSITGFFGLVMLTFVDLVRHPRRLRLPALVAQMEQVGVNAMPIVGLLSFLIGVVFAYQGADQLRRFGAEIYTVNLLGIAILRELGLVLTLPLLVVYADFMGLLGGCLMSWASLGILIPTFLDQLHSAIGLWTFWVGVIKAPFFAAIIALVGCYEGFNVARSADSVGRLTTQSVVEAIFIVIVADSAFSILFSLLKI